MVTSKNTKSSKSQSFESVRKSAADAIDVLSDVMESVGVLAEKGGPPKKVVAIKDTKAKKKDAKSSDKSGDKQPSKDAGKSKSSPKKGSEGKPSMKGAKADPKKIAKAKKTALHAPDEVPAQTKKKAPSKEEPPKEKPKAEPSKEKSSEKEKSSPAPKKTDKAAGAGGGSKAGAGSKADQEYQKKKQKSPLGPDHNPFKRYSHIGPAVGYKKPRENDQTDDWDCKKTGAYSQHCVNRKTGEEKDVNIDPDYKLVYNHLYRKWIKDQESFSAEKHGDLEKALLAKKGSKKADGG